MSDETPGPGPEPENPDESGASSPSRRPWKRRTLRRTLAIGVAIVAAALLTIFTVDLGRLWPGMVGLAERRGTTFLDRNLHIGRISAYITPGRFALHDVVIEGKNPGDRPFMTIERIDIEVPWWTLFKSELHVRLTLDNWSMVVESWANGVHNVPRLTGPKREPGGKMPFTTTIDWAYARGGSFVYEDHSTPWRVTAPNLNFSLVRATALNQYRGLAGFSGGEVAIQSFKPLPTSMTTRFVLDGPKVRLEHIDLVTDGSRSHVNGDVDFTKWPNQVYYVTSDVDFRKMKENFFSRESWDVRGDGVFSGTFRLFPGGRDLSGEFSSENAEVNGLEFPNLHGTLQWTPTYFGVTHAETDFLGGHARFSYSIAPLGSTGAMQTFTTDYTDIEVFDLDRLMSLRGLKLVGLASGDLSLQWPSGKFGSGRVGYGRTLVTPPAGLPLAPLELPPTPIPAITEPMPFDSMRRTGPLLIGVNTSYSIDPDGMTFKDSWAATTHSHITFSGRMGRDTSRFPFHVTSHDWQESDRLLASIMTAVSGPTGAVQVGGRGTFDGVMTGSFSSPLIEGTFAGESMRVWDVTWGRATADLAIQGGYVTIRNARIGDTPDRSIVPEGKFALGFRRDDAEEINAKVTLTNWPMVDLRHAFELDNWPMDGTVALADLSLTGKYREMFGSGTLKITDGRAWGEPFDEANGALLLEGTGMRISKITMRKGPGEIVGAARIGWDGTYAFDASGSGVPVETLDNFKIETAPLTGQLAFNITGAGEFEHPSYTFEGTIPDLFVASEGIGSVTGRFTITDKTMTIERLAAASSRLQVLGTGSIVFDEHYTSDLRFRFSETALDPYLKFFRTADGDGTAEGSGFNRIIVGGSLEVRGELARPATLSLDSTIDDATLTLFDYDLRNDGPLQLRMNKGRFEVVSLRLAGSGTNLAISGGGDLEKRVLDLAARGDSSLAVLGLFPQFAGITASGTARLNATVTGSFDTPRIAGDAILANGRIRPLNSPHSLDLINGRIEFGVNPTGANTIAMDDVSGRIGSGDVRFGGNIVLDGYRLVEYNLTATGRSMRLRYPTSFTSTVNMDLQLLGPFDAPRLEGTIDVLRVVFNQSADPGLFGIAVAGGAAAPLPSLTPAVPAEGTRLALNIAVTAPQLQFINTDEAQVEGTADLSVRGTFDQPLITGSVDLTGGQVTFFGNRYAIRDGVIRFPQNSTEPQFDVLAETRPRVQGQSFTITVGLSGTFSRISPTFAAEPYLSQTDIISIVFGGVPSILTTEERALGSSEEQQQILMQTMGAAIVSNILTSRVSGVFEQTGLLDSIQLTPVLENELGFQTQNPSARLTLSKRISQRVYLTYTRTLGDQTTEEIILLEYDQNDLLSWVLSRNEDRTFALDFRLRYVF